jgi:hypothetical protein
MAVALGPRACTEVPTRILAQLHHGYKQAGQGEALGTLVQQGRKQSLIALLNHRAEQGRHGRQDLSNANAKHHAH